jgi:hypothetical protein
VDGHPLKTPRPATQPPARTPALTAAELGSIVDVLLRTPGFDTREGRDLVLRELPFAAAITRYANDRPDTVSIVQAYARHPGGLEALFESIRSYAAGSSGMNELDTLMVFTSGNDGSAVRDAMVDLLEIAGYSITAEQAPERGSWFQRLSAKQISPEASKTVAATLAATVTNGLTADTINTVLQGGEIAVEVHLPHTTREERMAGVIARLLEACRGHDEVVIYMRPILLIKIGSSIIVREPTDDEHHLITANPRLLHAPRDLLAELDVNDKGFEDGCAS